MIINKVGKFIIVKDDMVSKPFLLATSHSSKLKTDKSLIEEFKKLNFTGEVFVDMLLKVGNGSQRFYSSFFNGIKFEINNTKVIENKQKIFKVLLEVERKVICKDTNILDNSLLTEYDKMNFYCDKY